jgi:integrase
MVAITESWLKANNKEQRQKKFIKADRDELNARISPKGKITFMMRYYYNNARKEFDIGTYPLMSLKEARVENTRLRKKLEQGHDPKVIRLVEKQTIADAHTLEGMFALWYEAYCKGNKKGHHEIKRSFEIHVFPKLGKLPAGDIYLHQWLAILEAIAKVKHGIADRLLTNTKQLLKWGMKRELLTSNVLAGINAKEDLQIKKKAGSRSLSDEEIKMFWLAPEQSNMAEKNTLFLKLCLIYACRNGELRLSKKEDFDFKAGVWTIPPENHKLGYSSGKPLLCPITKQIEPFVRRAFELSGDSEYTFTNRDTGEVMGKSSPLALPYNIMQWLRRHEDYEMEHWSVHDLRKTARTNFSSLTEFHLAEIMLGHSPGGVVQVYDHHSYLDEQAKAKAKAYEAWCDRLFGLVGFDGYAPANDNLIEFGKKRYGWLYRSNNENL